MDVALKRYVVSRKSEHLLAQQLVSRLRDQPSPDPAMAAAMWAPALVFWLQTNHAFSCSPGREKVSHLHPSGKPQARRPRPVARGNARAPRGRTKHLRNFPQRAIIIPPAASASFFSFSFNTPFLCKRPARFTAARGAFSAVDQRTAFPQPGSPIRQAVLAAHGFLGKGSWQ